MHQARPLLGLVIHLQLDMEIGFGVQDHHQLTLNLEHPIQVERAMRNQMIFKLTLTFGMDQKLKNNRHTIYIN